MLEVSGAATATWAATSPQLDSAGGLYCGDCDIAVPAPTDGAQRGVKPHAIDPARAAHLWALSARLTGHAHSPLVFSARDPFPPGGVVEDPATGAAAAAFAGYLRALGLIDPPRPGHRATRRGHGPAQPAARSHRC